MWWKASSLVGQKKNQLRFDVNCKSEIPTDKRRHSLYIWGSRRAALLLTPRNLVVLGRNLLKFKSSAPTQTLWFHPTLHCSADAADSRSARSIQAAAYAVQIHGHFDSPEWVAHHQKSHISDIGILQDFISSLFNQISVCQDQLLPIVLLLKQRNPLLAYKSTEHMTSPSFPSTLAG